MSESGTDMKQSAGTAGTPGPGPGDCLWWETTLGAIDLALLCKTSSLFRILLCFMH